MTSSLARTLGIAAIVAISVGCGAPRATPAAHVVPWADYAPAVRTTIDAAAAARDCAGLQGQFDSADANNAVVMAHTGHNNAELMGYIDDAMRSAGCHH